MLGDTQNAIRAHGAQTDLNLHSQFLGHWAHGFVPDHRFLLKAEQHCGDTLHGTLQRFLVPRCCRGAVQRSICCGCVPDREEGWKDWDIIREVFLTKHEEWAELRTVAPHLDLSHNFILVDIRQSFNCRFGQCVAKVLVTCGLALVRGTQEDNVLTEIIFSVFGLSQLSCQRFQTILAWLEEADALHVRHPIAVLVVYSVR